MGEEEEKWRWRRGREKKRGKDVVKRNVVKKLKSFLFCKTKQHRKYEILWRQIIVTFHGQNISGLRGREREREIENDLEVKVYEKII